MHTENENKNPVVLLTLPLSPRFKYKMVMTPNLSPQTLNCFTHFQIKKDKEKDFPDAFSLTHMLKFSRALIFIALLIESAHNGLYRDSPVI
jgi:hypothetical protein